MEDFSERQEIANKPEDQLNDQPSDLQKKSVLVDIELQQKDRGFGGQPEQQPEAPSGRKFKVKVSNKQKQSGIQMMNLCTLAFLIVFGIFIFNDQYHNYLKCDNQIIKWTKVLFASFIVFCVTGCMGIPLIRTKEDEHKAIKSFIGFIQGLGGLVSFIAFIALWTYYDELSQCSKLGTLTKVYLIMYIVIIGIVLLLVCCMLPCICCILLVATKKK